MGEQKVYYGGQAVMEGVMMRGRTSVALAVRAPDGHIVLHREQLTARVYTTRLNRWPFFRGLFMLWDMLVLGTRMMMFSANVALREKSPGGPGIAGTLLTILSAFALGASTDLQDIEEVEVGDGVLKGPAAFGMVAFSLIFTIGIFFVGPLLIVRGVEHFYRHPFFSAALEGTVRLSMFVIYLALIGRMPDIKRVFGYHGAEHKSINALEHNDPFTIAAAQKWTTAHPRCGTAFLLVVMVLSIFVFAFVELAHPALPLRILSRIVLVPVIASCAYEFIKFLSRYYDTNSFVRLIFRPMLALQALTTREPADDMVEVALTALAAVMIADGVMREDDVPAPFGSWSPVAAAAD